MPNAVDRLLYAYNLVKTWVNYTIPSLAYRTRNIRARWGR